MNDEPYRGRGGRGGDEPFRGRGGRGGDEPYRGRGGRGMPDEPMRGRGRGGGPPGEEEGARIQIRERKRGGEQKNYNDAN